MPPEEQVGAGEDVATMDPSEASAMRATVNADDDELMNAVLPFLSWISLQHATASTLFGDGAGFSPGAPADVRRGAGEQRAEAA